MKRLLLILAITMFACAVTDKTPIRTSTTERVRTVKTATSRSGTLLPTQTALSGSAEEEGLMDDFWSLIPLSVLPYCTIIGESDTQTGNYGQYVELTWGWIATTEQQVWDFIENAVYTITFDGFNIRDAVRGEVYEDEGDYVVEWKKDLGQLDRGTYTMTYQLEFQNQIYDGWNYYGPGSEIESEADTCFLVIQ